MNIFALISFILAVSVFLGGLYMSSPKLHLFVDPTSMFIVLGGTFAATAISFHLNKVFMLIKLFVVRTLTGKKVDMQGVVKELIQAIDSRKKGKAIQEIGSSSKDYFFKEALALIQDEVLDKDEILDLLEERNDNITEQYMKDNSKIKSISKFPPAFGMIGTTIGMIVLLDGLGGKDAMKTIGPAMSVCLITTLYGATVANLIVTPISENLNQASLDMHFKNRVVIEGIRLILSKANPIYGAEKLNSFLLPGDRVDWKKILKG